MPEPGEIAIAAIAAGAAIPGAVQATVGTATGSSGVNVSRYDVHHPKEFPPQQFAHASQSVQWDVIKFHGHGGYGDNNLAVAATGFVSNDNDCNISPWGGSGTSPEEPRRTRGRPCTCTVASIP